MSASPPSPSLLDWLYAHWQSAGVRRPALIGAGTLLGLIAAYLLVGAQDAGGWVFAGLSVWALWEAVRTARADVPVPDHLPRLTWREAVQVADDPTLTFAPRPALVTVDGRWLARVFRWPALLALAVLGNVMVQSQAPLVTDWGRVGLGLAFWGLALAGLAWAVQQERALLEVAATAQTNTPTVSPWAMRLTLLGGVVVAAGVTFWTAGGNRFNALNVGAWLLTVGLWLAVVWQGPVRAPLSQAVRALVQAVTHGHTVHVRAVIVLALGALLVGAYFRLADIATVPVEMTSDHVEKLMDVADLMLAGEHKIFFERNTGREPLQFYWTALVAAVFNLDISHLALKLGTALLGVLMLPAVFLLGRELEDDTLGLMLLALAAVSFWHTAISRVGLRFPLYPLFVAPTFYLVLRGLQQRSRNHFVLAGLVLGVSLFGYSPIRVLPLALLAVVGVYALWPVAQGWRLHLLANTTLMFVTAGLAFLPLARYALDNPAMFGERMASRLVGEYEVTVAGNPLMIFLQNNLNALLMFHWRGDDVWVNTVPRHPVLDIITGGLLILGLGYAVMRLLARRDWRMAALLVSLPILLLPSTLSLAFPNENPSVVRAGGAIPVVMALAAYPLWLTWRRVRALPAGDVARPLTALTLVVALGVAAWHNHTLYFDRYAKNYANSAENASEIGAVIRAFAESVGSYATAAVRPYPHWVDTRAVGMYAGDFWAGFPPLMHDYAIAYADLGRYATDPRAKLFILHPADVAGVRDDSDPPTLPELRRLYPNGTLSRHVSSRGPAFDFYLYTVPATQDVITP